MNFIGTILAVGLGMSRGVGVRGSEKPAGATVEQMAVLSRVRAGMG